MAKVTRYNRDTAFGLLGGNAVATGDIAGVDSNGIAVKADADAGTPIRAVGVVLIDRSATDPTVTVSDDCEVEYPGSNFTPGGNIYLSGTAGGITQTAPTATGAVRQVLGTALSATKVRFHIVPAQLVVQGSGSTTVAFG